jgi:hypothetical protein
MAITDEVLNELLKDYQKPEDLLGKDGLLKQLQKLGSIVPWEPCHLAHPHRRQPVTLVPPIYLRGTSVVPPFYLRSTSVS